jgi:hypothetical protein
MAITKLNNKAVANITTLPVALGDMVFISSATASSSASIEFSLGNYKEYQFYFVNMHPSVDAGILEFQTSINGGSSYGITITSSAFYARLAESDAGAFLTYQADHHLAQSTSYQKITSNIGNDNDQSASGTLTLFNPSSSVYVKHFISSTNTNIFADYTYNVFRGGYFNTTSALTNIKFQMSSGNIDAGKILMFGIN